jgi:hypothetical protein
MVGAIITGVARPGWVARLSTLSGRVIAEQPAPYRFESVRPGRYVLRVYRRSGARVMLMSSRTFTVTAAGLVTR